ncbi:MAG: hypothetical protein ACRDNY_07145 [Gaiellaceae bacterium]
MRRKTRMPAITIVVIAVAGIAAWGSLEVAAQVQEPAPLPTYNGCLSAVDGTFYGFRADAVVQCEDDDAPASLSSGDVTEVAGSGGIAGGAKSGPATLAIEPTYRLPQDCGAGDSIAYGGGGWGCLAPLEPSEFAKSDQSCPPGQVVAGIGPLGIIVCVAQAQAKGPATDWSGLSIRHRDGESRRESMVMVYNPNAETARVSVFAFDLEGREQPPPTAGFRGDCRALPIPAGGTRTCDVVDESPIGGEGVVHVHADLPVLPFGEQREIGGGARHRWQLDWYPLCPEHVDTCK